MATISIVGYEQDGNCEHCGRPLKHCIRLDDGRIVGATCLDKKLTKPKVYMGKKYRLGSSEIIRIARMVERYSPATLANYGIYAASTTFEAA